MWKYVLKIMIFDGIYTVDSTALPGVGNTPKINYHFLKDAAGYVHQLGEGVTNLKVGDRVFVAGTSSNSGSYAQFVVSDATFVFPLHERLTFAQVMQ